MRRVVFRAVARRELDHAIEWYERQHIGLGVRLLEEVDACLQEIAIRPEIFKKVRGEVRRVLLRRFPYAIHFLPERSQIVVLAIFQPRRNPGRLQDPR